MLSHGKKCLRESSVTEVLLVGVQGGMKKGARAADNRSNVGAMKEAAGVAPPTKKKRVVVNLRGGM